MKVEEAQKKICPLISEYNSPSKCSTIHCMAWNFLKEEKRRFRMHDGKFINSVNSTDNGNPIRPDDVPEDAVFERSLNRWKWDETILSDQGFCALMRTL